MNDDELKRALANIAAKCKASGMFAVFLVAHEDGTEARTMAFNDGDVAVALAMYQKELADFALSLALTQQPEDVAADSRFVN